MAIFGKFFDKRRRAHRIEEDNLDNEVKRQLAQLFLASNYRPLDYYYTDAFFKLYTDGERIFSSLINETNADDLNSGMFLPMIRAARDEQKAFAQSQYQEHVDASIDKIDRKVVGALALAHDLLGRLEQARSATDSEYETFRQLKENELRGHLSRSSAGGTDRSEEGE